MFRLLFLLFVIIPVIEIAVLMHVGAWIGAWPTIGIVIFTAWLGAKNVRQQGIATLNSVQTKMAQGQMPSEEIVTGLLLLVAGVLLVTPGFVTDIFGLSLLIPQVRQSLVNAVRHHLVSRQVNGSTAHFQANVHHAVNDDEKQKTSPPRQGETLEGEFERKE